MKQEAEKIHRELWPGGPLYAGDPVQTDSLVLAHFAAGRDGETVCDLGCGSGILLLLLLRACPSLSVTGVECRPRAAEECRENLRKNAFSGEILTGDLRTAPLPAGLFDLVIANPPYFRAGAGGVSPDTDRAIMRQESATLPELCAAAAELLSPEGRFCLVHRVERQEEVLAALTGAGLSLTQLRFFQYDTRHDPALFFAEARRRPQAKPIVLPPLLQRCEDGRETAEYRKITHWEA